MTDVAAISRQVAQAACPCCGSALSAPFYEVGPVPVHSCLMLDRPEDARAFPTGMVRLSLCQSCGFVTNTAFDPRWSAYAPNYEDQQSFSPTFNSFAGQLAQDLVVRHELEGRRAIEIGCSKGDFMALLCDAGGMDCVGIDPSAVEGRVAPPSRGSMRFLAEYYGRQHLDVPADLFCCRHTLEHIRDVDETLRLIGRHMEANPGAVLCIEVPDATRIWRTCAFEDIYYEHCSYFTAGSLAAAVRRAGFAVTDLRREYGDQYLVLEASLDGTRDRKFSIEESPAETVADVERFRERIGNVLAAWHTRIAQVKETGARVAVWGSGSKCVAFLRTLGVEGLIDAIVDINPHREGRIAPGLSRPIGLPQSLLKAHVGLLIAMNPIYRDEIAVACGKMALDADLLALGDDPAGRRVSQVAEP